MPRFDRPRFACGAAAAGTALALGAVLGMSACSSSTPGGYSTTNVTTPSVPPTGNFSGTAPSALQSLQSAGIASAASASASNEARASAFASSAAAESAAAQAAYKAALAPVTGSGNAVGEVFLTGVPKAQTGGLHATIVNITNRSSATASYAVQINWNDTSGHTVDTDIVGTQNLPAGGKATPVAFSTKDADLTLIPVVAKAQRF